MLEKIQQQPVTGKQFDRKLSLRQLSQAFVSLNN